MAPNMRRRSVQYSGIETTSWSIEDFKSIESASLSLRPGEMTVLTGTNSIGKSSLLQSILMLCQSMNNYGSELVLNGALTRLGIPEDIIRDGSSSCQIGIEYTVVNRRERERDSTIRCTLSLKPSRQGVFTSDLSTLSISSLRIALENGQEFLVQSTGISREDISACKELVSWRDRRTSEPTVLKASLSYGGRLTRTYVTFRGLQPVAVIKLRSDDAAIRAHEQGLRSFIASGFRAGSRGDVRYLNELRRELLPRNENNHGLATPTFSFRDDKRLSQIIEKMDDFEKGQLIHRIAESAASRNPHIIQFIDESARMPGLGRLGEEDEGQGAFRLLLQVLNGLSCALNDVATRVEYIGPLRDDPRVISPLTEEVGSNLPIGIKGERAAAVLLAAYDSTGIYGLPNSFKPELTTLGNAVDAWSQYLGVANTVHASNKQKLGVSINIDSGGAERDLTQVGVGASQAIPILVGILDAERDSIVIIEQPELHLHPSAQAKLADFLLFARPDITVLVESHSEALVTRLRRRVVEDELLAKRINIQFFERTGADGGVIGQDLEIDAYGNLNNWPEGFMDAVQEDSRIIMKTAIAKRKSGRGSDGSH